MRLVLISTVALLVAATFVLLSDRDTREVEVTTIVLITPDTLRRDHVERLTVKDDISPSTNSNTPNLDALASRSIRFTNAWSPVPLTLPAHVSMFTGLPPTQTGIRVNASPPIPSRSKRNYPLLAEQLQADGWHTAGFVSAGVLGKRYGIHQGFRHFDDGDLDDLSKLTVPERAGPKTVQAALAHIKSVSKDERLFVWVHLFDPHRPYASPRGYKGDIHVADRSIGTLLQGLEKLGRSNAVIMVASDHGESLGALGEATHGMLLSSDVLRVPFILAGANASGPPRNDDRPTCLTDIAPTLAHIAGMEWPTSSEGPGTGRNVLDASPIQQRHLPAESLFANSRYRWAQLSGAIGTEGILVDAGLGRHEWIRHASGPGKHASIDVAVDFASLREHATMLKTLSDYQASDRGDRSVHAEAPFEYGGAAQVIPFMAPEKNARLPNPREHIKAAERLDQLAAQLRGTPPNVDAPAKLREELRAVCERDPNNAEAHFWRAEALRRHGRVSGSAAASADSEAAYLRSWELGRRAPAALLMACMVNAVGREAQMLERLVAMAKDLPTPDFQVEILRARFLQALGREKDAKDACTLAESLCKTKRQRALLARTCR